MLVLGRWQQMTWQRAHLLDLLNNYSHLVECLGFMLLPLAMSGSIETSSATSQLLKWRGSILNFMYP
eukprot:10629020-Ditylum_brightwellii.AAC.1